eukprot:TRINITY_DN305_c0_g3_i1.p1 TRINITY_DN305_c0_g3~~TRINITY_DN305_c0_g3_i1.p1  ORF type:complete len:240 (-),score=51.21 TRINITY_DN305_c0_g3_i1:98-817(-)
MAREKLGLLRGVFLSIGLLVTPVLFASWIVNHLGGFAGADEASTNAFFNWHIFTGSATVFWVFFPSSLIYHVGLSFKVAKTIHWVALTAATVGFFATVTIAYEYHQAAGYEDYYSVHSWMGMLTTVIFATQWVFGVLVLLCNCGPATVYSRSRRFHILVGLSLCVLVLGTIWTGLMEKQKFLTCSDSSTNYCASKTWANVLAVWIAVYAIAFLSPWFAPSSSSGLYESSSVDVPLRDQI